MREVFLKDKIQGTDTSRRGGVSSSSCGPMGITENEIEIGNDCNASIEMLALCALIDEIVEYLKLSDSSLAKLILHKYLSEIDRLSRLNSEIAVKCQQPSQVIMESTDQST